jgi:peptidoglycan-associated lipoprotein
MKKALLILLLGALIAIVYGCGPKPTPPPPEQPKVVDTTTPPPAPKPVEPEKPKATLQETQFKTVYFDFDKYDLRSDAKASLDADFALLQEFPDAIVKVEGHCDERGSVEYNLSLGEKRAKAVVNYLVGRGVATARLSMISYGKERPVDNGHNEAAWAKNRRAEFKVISQ